MRRLGNYAEPFSLKIVIQSEGKSDAQTDVPLIHGFIFVQEPVMVLTAGFCVLANPRG